MKKLLLALGLSALALTGAQAQGTINPLNGTLTRVKVDSNCNGVYDAADGNLPADIQLRFGVFWGTAGSSPDNLAGVLTVGATAGILTGLPTIFSVQGWGDVGTVISLRIRVIDNLAWYGDTGVKQVTLAPAAGPGTVIWGSTATASRFSPILINPCPEPSTLALGGLACGFLLLRARKSHKR